MSGNEAWNRSVSDADRADISLSDRLLEIVAYQTAPYLSLVALDEQSVFGRPSPATDSSTAASLVQYIDEHQQHETSEHGGCPQTRERVIYRPVIAPRLAAIRQIVRSIDILMTTARNDKLPN